MPEQRFHVEHLTEQSRYVLLDRGAAEASPMSTDLEIGEESYLDFAAPGGTERILFHTGVAEKYGGQGLASVLVRAVVEDTIAAGLHVVPVCPYVAAWLPKHPEYAAHVVQPRSEHLRALRAN